MPPNLASNVFHYFSPVATSLYYCCIVWNALAHKSHRTYYHSSRIFPSIVSLLYIQPSPHRLPSITFRPNQDQLIRLVSIHQNICATFQQLKLWNSNILNHPLSASFLLLTNPTLIQLPLPTSKKHNIYQARYCSGLSSTIFIVSVHWKLSKWRRHSP